MSGTVSGFAAGQETELYGIGSGEVATAPTSQVLGNSWSSMWGDENPTARLFYAARRNLRNIAARDGGSERYLTAEEANAEFGIPGLLTFSAPLAESSARELRERAQARAAREDIAARANSGVTEWTARGAISLVAAALDPLNVASAFVPVVGQTRAAAWVGAGGGAMGRIAASARIGAIEGTAGALMLEPVMFGLARSEGRNDYGMADSLLNVAFGAGFGALLHGAGRGIIDGFRGIPADPRLAAEMHETAVRAAAAQVQRGDPVDVRPVFDAARAAPEAPEPQAPRAASNLLGGALDRGRLGELRWNDIISLGGDGGSSPWLLPDGRWAETGGDHISVLDQIDGVAPAGRTSDQIQAEYGSLYNAVTATTGAVSMQFGKTSNGGWSVFLRVPEWVSLTPEQAAAVGRLMETEGAKLGVLVETPAGTTTRLRGDEAAQFLGLNAAEDRRADIPAIVQRAAASPVRPEDAAAVARAQEARARAEGAQRVETRLARTEAEAATLEKQAADTDAVLAELVRAGRLTQAEADAVSAPAAAERVKQRIAGIEAGAACLIANGA